MLHIVQADANEKRVRTTTELNTFLNCRRKYELRNVRQLRPVSPKRWSSWGRAFHRFDELYHSGQPLETALSNVRPIFFGDDIADLDLEDSWEGFVHIAHGYADLYPVRASAGWVEETISGLRFRPNMLEVPFKVPIFTPGGRRSAKAEYAGIFDGIVEDAQGNLWLYETKTAANLTEAFFDKLGFDRQVLRYVYAARQIFGSRVKGVLYNAISKTAPRTPEIRQDGSLSSAAVITTPTLLDEALRSCRQRIAEKAAESCATALAEAAIRWDLQSAAQFLAHTLHEETDFAWGYLVHRAELEPEGKARETAFKKLEKAKADQAKYREIAESATKRLFYARRFREIGNEVLEEIQWELYQLDRDVDLAEKDGRFYPNERACEAFGGCEYKSLCHLGEYANFVETPTRHLELPPEGFLMPTNPRPIKSALADALKALQDDNQLEAE